VKDQYTNDSYFGNVVTKYAKGACDGFFMHEGCSKWVEYVFL
jgi:hypothetical protein